MNARKVVSDAGSTDELRRALERAERELAAFSVRLDELERFLGPTGDGGAADTADLAECRAAVFRVEERVVELEHAVAAAFAGVHAHLDRAIELQAAHRIRLPASFDRPAVKRAALMAFAVTAVIVFWLLTDYLAS